MKNFFYWVEIPSVDFYRAVAFYSQVLQIELNPLDWGEEKMACLPNDEGAISYSPGFKPSVDGIIVNLHAGNDIDTMIKRIVEAGGKIVRPKTKIEAEGKGYFALFIDSEGNRLGIYGDN
jgi:uncharacterized protein